MNARPHLLTIVLPLLPLLFLQLVGVGCGESPIADGFRTEEVTCTSCHGRGDDPAPPRSLSGSALTTERGVGAHRQHLRDGAIRAAMACSECHLVPRDVDAAGHVDALPAEVAFGPLARSHDTDARWQPDSLTCATYCHGDARPSWTRVDGSYSRCDSCHGSPPPAPHPQSTRCVTCHAETVDELGRIRLDRGLHVNGVVDSKGTACTSCHGSPDAAGGAPPFDLSGANDASARGVGAHTTHLDGDRHLAVDCASCHLVPLAVGDEGHADDNDARAEVVFGALAVHELRDPRYDLADVGCSNTYCHGGAEPIWTRVDGTYSACNSCHGYPPTAPHPARADCTSCHGMVVNADDSFVAAELHVDGVVQSAGVACNSCHGSAATAAPPTDTLGNTTTDAPGVGAHATHLAPSTTHASIACGECHVVPIANGAAGHYDTSLPSEVTFGPRARARGAEPVYDGAGCSNVACHGSAAPIWTTVNGSQAACGTCHGTPPAAPHPARTDCVACHGPLDARHVDGKVDVACNACHGNDDGPAPPSDLAGNVDTTFPGVGAHAAHLRATELHEPVACSECHAVPSALDSPGHRDDLDNTAEVHFGPLANADGVDSDYDGVTCATYCHGGSAFIQGGSLTNPSWTVVDGTQGACGSCHGLPPPAPHPTVPPTSCGGCHPFSGTIPLVPALHINGVVERP